MNNKYIRSLILILVDIGIIFLASAFTYVFISPYALLAPSFLIVSTGLATLTLLILSSAFGIYTKVNRYTSIKETLIHMAIVLAAYFLSYIVSLGLFPFVPSRYFILSTLITMILIPGARVFWRIIFEHQMKVSKTDVQVRGTSPTRTLIIGGGEAGALLIRGMRKESDIHFVGILDDDPHKRGRKIYGVKVLGDSSIMDKVIRQYNVEQVTIAIPSLSSDDLNRIVTLASEAEVKVNQMPSIESVLSGQVSIDRLEDIEVTDLLGREEVELDMEAIGQQLANRTVLITGAGGSIGSEIARQIMRFSPKRLLLLGHGEFSIYQIHRELQKSLSDDTEIIPLIADIQDRDRIFSLMKEYRPDRVYHAAAHKHVPMMEANPREAVKNNVFGTLNVAQAAKEAGVKAFVMISTDKAVNPPNVMGATKRIAELIVTGMNDEGSTQFVAVRFGNVLNSRGSVVPLFKEQIASGGPITVTDYRMTRYFMTIPEASRLVLQAGSLAKGGEIFVLDMGEPVKIYDLARKMVHLSGKTEQEIKIVEAGIRPGEKLYEELLTETEAVKDQVYEKIFVGNVQTMTLEKVLEFVHKLEALSTDELRKTLVQFANEHN